MKNASDDSLRKYYLESALNSFNLATAVEKNENLISAYVGLAICQFLLGDKNNAQNSLSMAEGVCLEKSEIVKSQAKLVGKEVGKIYFMYPYLLYKMIRNKDPYFPYNLYKRIINKDYFRDIVIDERQKRFDEYKKKALSVKFE